MEKTEKTGSHEDPTEINRLIDDLERKLIHEYGMLLHGASLQRATGYDSLESLRQAIKRRTFPIRVFSIDNRRGKFATARDVAHWLIQFEDVVGSVETKPTTRD